MYGQQPLFDIGRAVKAMLSNQLARAAPRFYVRLTKQTGRGSGPENPREVADYFMRSFQEYFVRLEIAPADIETWLAGKRVLEYGPGDIPGVGLLMLAHGAASVTCVDRFPLAKPTLGQAAVLRALFEGLSGRARERASESFVNSGEPASGIREDRLLYLVRRDGLSGIGSEIDLVYSRAVLEHVNDLDATFADMERALKPGMLAIHQVDLKSHGLHRDNVLDFLTWPVWLWDLMYSAKGVPNRWRIDRYRRALDRAGLEVHRLEPTVMADPEEVAEVRPFLAKPFRNLDDTALAWLGFWLVAQKPDRAGRAPGAAHELSSGSQP